MIVAYVCVYSSTRSSKRSSIEKETRKPFALASTKAFFVLRSARKGRFPPSFRFTFIHENHPSDIIAKKCFPSLPLLSSFLRPARTRYEILFPSFSLCFPFFAFFASKRFALRRFVVAVFLSLSLSRGIPGGKSMDRHRAIFHASPLPLLFRARLFATETAEDFSFSRLFSFLDEMKRRAMISSHRLPLLPGRRRAKDRFGVSGKKYSRSSLSLSLSLSLYFHHHPSHDEHKTEHREEGCLEEQQQHGREERGVVGGDHRHHLFFRRRVGGRHRRRVRRHLRQGPRRFWRQIAAKTSG